MPSYGYGRDPTTKPVMEIISRKNALSQGLTHYFTGKPCKHGHVAKRGTASKNCIDCCAMRSRAHYATHLKGNKIFQEKNRQRAMAWYQENHERARETRDAYSAALGDKEVARQNERSRLRMRGMRDAIRKLSREERRQTRAIYQLRLALSKATGVPYHVDHRIPLSKGGKHHPDNLWVIPAVENLRKGAKLPA